MKPKVTETDAFASEIVRRMPEPVHHNVDPVIDVKRRAGISTGPSNFPELGINHVREFGSRYGQEIHDLVVKNNLGGYVGYRFQTDGKHVDIFGRVGAITVDVRGGRLIPDGGARKIYR